MLCYTIAWMGCTSNMYGCHSLHTTTMYLWISSASCVVNPTREAVKTFYALVVWLAPSANPKESWSQVVAKIYHNSSTGARLSCFTAGKLYSKILWKKSGYWIKRWCRVMYMYVCKYNNITVWIVWKYLAWRTPSGLLQAFQLLVLYLSRTVVSPPLMLVVTVECACVRACVVQAQAACIHPSVFTANW